MTIGFIYDGGSTYITPDKGLTRTKNPKVLVADFGDGYEQRIADGINSLKEEISLNFATRPKAIIDDVCAFLDATKGVTKFSLIIPDSNVLSDPSGPAGVGEKEIKVRFRSYNLMYDYGDFYSLSVQLIQVFEA